eukprot:11018212-Lingulodinium_polyedra.AAC.1
MKGALLAVRRSGLAPLAWHKSRAGVLRKSDLEGPKGRRVVHVLDVLGKAFYVNLMEAKGLSALPAADHGFAKNRRREGAVLVQQCSSFRLRAAGVSHLDCAKDMSNAFGST